MAAGCKVTVSGTRLGGISVTSHVINNAAKVEFDFDKKVIKVTRADNFVEEFSISAASTISGTASSGVYTFTVS